MFADGISRVVDCTASDAGDWLPDSSSAITLIHRAAVEVTANVPIAGTVAAIIANVADIRPINVVASGV